MSIWEAKKRLINRANQRPPEIIMPPGNEICQRQSSFLGVFDVWGKFLEMWSVQTEIWDEERTNKEVMWWATWFENIFVCLPTQFLFWAIRLCLPFFCATPGPVIPVPSTIHAQTQEGNMNEKREEQPSPVTINPSVVPLKHIVISTPITVFSATVSIPFSKPETLLNWKLEQWTLSILSENDGIAKNQDGFSGHIYIYQMLLRSIAQRR